MKDKFKAADQHLARWKYSTRILLESVSGCDSNEYIRTRTKQGKIETFKDMLGGGLSLYASADAPPPSASILSLVLNAQVFCVLVNTKWQKASQNGWAGNDLPVPPGLWLVNESEHHVARVYVPGDVRDARIVAHLVEIRSALGPQFTDLLSHRMVGFVVLVNSETRCEKVRQHIEAAESLSGTTVRCFVVPLVENLNAFLKEKKK